MIRFVAARLDVSRLARSESRRLHRDFHASSIVSLKLRQLITLSLDPNSELFLNQEVLSVQPKASTTKHRAKKGNAGSSWGSDS